MQWGKVEDTTDFQQSLSDLERTLYGLFFEIFYEIWFKWVSFNPGRAVGPTKLQNPIGIAVKMVNKKRRSSSYQLSDESIKSGKEFGYATRAASGLKRAFSPLVFDKYGSELHKRLLSRIIEVLNTGPIEEKGKRTLAHGRVGLLEGLELNPYANFSSLIYSFTFKVEIVPEFKRVNIQLPAIVTDGFAWPDRGTTAFLDVRCVVSDVHGLTHEVYALESVAFLRSSKQQAAPKAAITVVDMEDRLITVAVGVSFLRADGSGFDDLISHNRRYYAARLFEAAYIKNGKVVVFEAEERAKSNAPPESSNAHIIQWDAD